MKKVSGITIDIIILVIFAFLLMICIYVIYEFFPTLSRIIAVLIDFVMMLIIGGTIICSTKGKKTIGNRIANKSNNK